TRFSRDWSSDVCSSDLADVLAAHVDDVTALVIDRRRPVVVPHLIPIGGGTGDAGPGTIEPFGIAIPTTGRIAHRDVGHVEVAYGPARRVLRRRVHANAKERDLIAESSAVGRVDIAGVVPPLDPVVRVRRVVAWELERVG